jgi:hypothetical protein
MVIRRSIKASTSTRAMHRPIMAADEDDPGFNDFEDEGAGFDADDEFGDILDDMADNIEELQDDVDEIQEDDVNIDVDNNIDNHYIAECDRCHGIFISAMVESDQEVEKVTGVCPLCEKESDQYLKWVIHAVE